ncbi:MULTISPECIES: YitT family protein [Paraliobacillus]|uniref:YitT family protein n=1 Tax=Paraliobacillus TaxID=200903 RepID=UPI000DD3AFFF|nr:MULTISPECIES: YitT family protein [Paraliobacillus]
MKRIMNIIFGIIIVSVGVLTLKHATIITGGTAGLALNLSYLILHPFSLIFFLVNIPFYLFSFIRMGWRFTLTTILSVSFLSILTSFDLLLPTITLPIWFGAVLGGTFIGLGLSLLFANGSSLGGANILALFLHKRYNFNPGTTNFLFDLIVVMTGIYTVGFIRVLASIISIAMTSFIISYFKSRIAEKNANMIKVKKTVKLQTQKIPTH